MSLEADFQAAAEKARSMPSNLSTDTKKQIYSLFKQASVGDCKGDRPGMFDMTGRAKYDSWKALEGMSQDEAKQKYIALIESL